MIRIEYQDMRELHKHFEKVFEKELRWMMQSYFDEQRDKLIDEALTKLKFYIASEMSAISNEKHLAIIVKSLRENQPEADLTEDLE